MTGKSGRGKPRQTIRMDEDLWNALGEAAASVGTDRSSVIRDFARWYIGDPEVPAPERPDPAA